jgi:hypothetical protein
MKNIGLKCENQYLILIVFILMLLWQVTIVPDVTSTEIKLGDISGLDSEGNALANKPLIFTFEWINNYTSNVISFQNGYKVWTSNNGYTSTFSPIFGVELPIMYDYFENVIIYNWESDGVDQDTINFAGYGMTAEDGYPPGTDTLVYQLETKPAVVGDTICIDSISWYPPNNDWEWQFVDYTKLKPTWNGPYCFHVDANCGDAKSDGIINILDVTHLINYIYNEGNPAELHECIGDINGGGTINLLDITYLISYIYKNGPPPIENCCQPIW